MEQRIPKHVFISFAMKDIAVARRVAMRLEGAGVSVWIAPNDLVPGTRDWEAAIRDAIADSFALVLLASPASRGSRFVRGELSLAEASSVLIIPVWIDGESWPESIPLGEQHRQYIDLLGERKAAGEEALVGRLRDVVEKALPFHLGATVTAHCSWPDLRLPGFACVILAEREGACDVAMFRMSHYRQIGDLLDDLFVHYLSTRFEAYTYGEQWLLTGGWNAIRRSYSPDRVLVPFKWLGDRTGTFASWDVEWLQSLPEIDAGEIWRVAEVPIEAWGVAVHDRRILDLLHHPKRILGIEKRGVLLPLRYDDVDQSAYPVKAVVCNLALGWPDQPDSGTVLAQIADSSRIEYLLRPW